MTIRLADDVERIGHAVLELDREPTGPLSLSLQFPDKTYLGPDGTRTRRRHLFSTEPCDDRPCRRYRLGPEVTSHVLEAEFVTFADAEGDVLGSVDWEGIRVLPKAGAGAPLGRTQRVAAPGPPILPPPPVGPSPGSHPPVEEEKTSAPPAGRSAPPPPAPVPRRRWFIGLGAASLLAAAAGLMTAALTGLIGWDLRPMKLEFSGPAGGPFRPPTQEARFTRAWWLRPVAPLMFGDNPPISRQTRPAWLDLRARQDGVDWIFTAVPKADATRDLAPSSYDAELPLVFPLRREAHPGLIAILTIEPGRPAALSPARSQPPSRRPRPEEPRPTVDDVACDRLAGNRFDPDHPADRGHKDEIFDLSAEDLVAGLLACDPRPDRSGPDRRFVVQRGRLLAHRALRRLEDGDLAGATQDMAEAVATWQRAEARGSAYAANLLGAYYKGTFNRPAKTFVTPDDRLADEHWLKAMQGGSVVGQRNYAAQLLMGRGTRADPSRALALLREALGRGDIRSAGVLGVALTTGVPAGVPLDKDKGWPFIVQAQCVDRDAGALLNKEIASGARPASDRHSCS